ncbi:MAG: hypothetical protein ABH813_00560, partial [Patescibacteria group bacterium]
KIFFYPSINSGQAKCDLSRPISPKLQQGEYFSGLPRSSRCKRDISGFFGSFPPSLKFRRTSKFLASFTHFGEKFFEITD